MALCVEGALEQQSGGSLVDHGTALPGVAATLRKRSMGDDGREAFVDESDRNRSDHGCERFGKVSCLVSSLSSSSGKACGKADHNLGRMPGSR